MTGFGTRLLAAALLLTLVGCDPAIDVPDQSQRTTATPSRPVMSQAAPATGGPAIAAASGTAECADPKGEVKGVDLTAVRITGDGHRLAIVFQLAKALPANGYLSLGATGTADRSAIYFLSPDKTGKARQFYWLFDQPPVSLNDVRIAGSTITLVFPAASLKGFPAHWTWHAAVGVMGSGDRRIESDTCPDVTRQIGLNKFPG
ncbi:hypothetical protein [Kribbella sp. NPDC051718]|uniref:hypothetical protein n=1 Tax=Kribbella sp. NPDC051718 TaxID=3155168 RepID=UPI003420A7F5